jgi:AcrR family transcriptional regulator
MSHEFAAVTINGVRKALLELGWFDEVLAAASATTRESLQHVEARRYHPGSVLDEVVDLLAQKHDLAAPETMMRTVVARSLEGIVAPLARVFITIMGNSPRVLLEKFDTLIQASSRGVHAKWEAEGPTAGVLTLSYGVARSLAVAHGWKGALLHLLVFCKTQGTVDVLEFGDGGNSVRLRVRWS